MTDGPVLQLPSGLRRITFASLVVSALVGFGSAQSIAVLFEPAVDQDFSSVRPLPMLEGNPELYQQALKAMAGAQLSAYQSMRGSRSVILMGLSITSALVFVSALRLIRPAGAPREGVRRLLGAAALLTAVLRTLEGAQSAAVARRAGNAFDKVLAASSEIPGGWPEEFMATAYTGMSMFLSLLVGGGLLTLSLYYRSERVRAVTVDLDGER